MPTTTTFAKVDPPTKMPAFEVQKIKDLKCPLPILPSKATAKINALNSEMQTQMSEIANLEQQVRYLEKVYKISFTCNNNPKFDVQSNELPSIDLSGSITNINLDFHLWEAATGIKGMPGNQGDFGVNGPNAIAGPAGISGYYGIRGNTK
jgi:hypothetical protein